MVGSNGTMIAIRLVRSKLRKREEHSHHHHHHHHHHHGNTVHPEQVQQCCSGVSSQQQQQQQQQQREEAIRCDGDGGIVNPAMTGSTMTVDSCCAVATQSATSTIVAALGNGCTERTSPESGYGGTATTTANAEQFIWQFPPPYPPPNTPPPQYTLYNDQILKCSAMIMSLVFCLPVYNTRKVPLLVLMQFVLWWRRLVIFTFCHHLIILMI